MLPSRIASSDYDGWNGYFLVPIEGDVWCIALSDREGWKHLAVFNAQKKIAPNWSVMCRIKDLFFADDEWAIQFHPPKDHSIDDVAFRLHLWSPLNETLPHPEVLSDERSPTTGPD
jgi:hypothetical protein